MDILLGAITDREEILAQYPYTKQVLGNGGILIVAKANDIILGFLWAFEQEIPVSIEKKKPSSMLWKFLMSKIDARALGVFWWKNALKRHD